VEVIDNGVKHRNDTAHPIVHGIFMDQLRSHLQDPNCIQYLASKGVLINDLGMGLDTLLASLLAYKGQLNVG